jgi:hypothetical protein
MKVEAVVKIALEQAAADYRQDRGRFSPFAENRIHAALEDYQKALRHVPKKVVGGRYRDGVDPAAIRRGLMMTGCP